MTPWDKLVAELGEEGARQEMKRRRSLVKNLGKGGFAANKELAKRASRLGVEARKKLHEDIKEDTIAA